MRDGEASETARRVAAHRLCFERFPWPHGDPTADEALARDVAADLAVDESTRIAAYLRARTAYFDRFVVDGLRGGAHQLVAIGAGYDGRALRYAAPGVTWFELDHPDTQRDKRRRLEGLGLTAASITFVRADLRDGAVGARLVEAGLSPTAASAVLMEGVAAYLDDDVLAAVLHCVRDVVALGTRFAVSVGASDSPSVRERRAALAASVARLGERFTSSVTVDSIETVAGAGWRVIDPATASGCVTLVAT